MASISAMPLFYTLRQSRVLVRESVPGALERCISLVASDSTCRRGLRLPHTWRFVPSAGAMSAPSTSSLPRLLARARYAEAAVAPDSRHAELTVDCSSHADLRFLHVSEGDVAATVYNLGWYPAPRADRTDITVPSSTVACLCQARRLLAVHRL